VTTFFFFLSYFRPRTPRLSQPLPTILLLHGFLSPPFPKAGPHGLAREGILIPSWTTGGFFEMGNGVPGPAPGFSSGPSESPAGAPIPTSYQVVSFMLLRAPAPGGTLFSCPPLRVLRHPLLFFPPFFFGQGLLNSPVLSPLPPKALPGFLPLWFFFFFYFFYVKKSICSRC